MCGASSDGPFISFVFGVIVDTENRGRWLFTKRHLEDVADCLLRGVLKPAVTSGGQLQHPQDSTDPKASNISPLHLYAWSTCNGYRIAYGSANVRGSYQEDPGLGRCDARAYHHRVCWGGSYDGPDFCQSVMNISGRNMCTSPREVHERMASIVLCTTFVPH